MKSEAAALPSSFAHWHPTAHQPDRRAILPQEGRAGRSRRWTAYFVCALVTVATGGCAVDDANVDPMVRHLVDPRVGIPLVSLLPTSVPLEFAPGSGQHNSPVHVLADLRLITMVDRPDTGTIATVGPPRSHHTGDQVWFFEAPPPSPARGPELVAFVATSINDAPNSLVLHRLALTGDRPAPGRLESGLAVGPDRFLLFSRRDDGPARSDLNAAVAWLGTLHEEENDELTLDFDRLHPIAGNATLVAADAIVDRPDELFAYFFFAPSSPRQSRSDLDVARARRDRASDPIAFDYFRPDDGRWYRSFEPFRRPLAAGVGAEPVVAWSAAWNRFVLVYQAESESPSPRGASTVALLMRLSDRPEGPWSDPIGFGTPAGAGGDLAEVAGARPVALIAGHRAGRDGGDLILAMAGTGTSVRTLFYRIPKPAPPAHTLPGSGRAVRSQ